MDDFERQLQETFLEEATQLIDDAEQCFLSLESDPDNKELLEKIFRLAHNLKGSAKAVGFDQVSVFTHQFESLLLKLKSGELPVTGNIVGLLLRSNDHISFMIKTLKESPQNNIENLELIEEIKAHMNGEVSQNTHSSNEPMPDHSSAPTETDHSPVDIPNDAPPLESTDAPPPAAEGFVNFSDPAVTAAIQANLASMSPANPEGFVNFSDPAVTAAIQATLGSSPVAPADKPTAPVLKIVPEAKVATPAPAAAAKPAAQPSTVDESIRVSIKRLEKLLNFVGEMVILQTVLNEQATGTGSTLLRKTVHQLGKVTKEVQDISMSLRMVPIKQNFQKMQRIVRDTSALLGKKINLVLHGEETELDKTVLENISDPLVHLVRNAVDHGIESGADRVKAGKPEVGTVTLSAYHHGGKLVIDIVDDGGGINTEVLQRKAIEKKLIRPDAKLTEKEKINLIFKPGFSTKAVVSEVSGRGVGMDVVKNNIASLQGEVDVTSTMGKGSCFKITLPLTMAIIDGMTVRIEKERYVIPLSHVHESVRPTLADIHLSAGVGEVLLLRGENLPIYRLSSLLAKKTPPAAATDCIAIVVRTSQTPFAILVDDILGQQQVVVKKLGAEIKNTHGFSGSAILGDGRPALILELSELVNSAVKMGYNRDVVPRRKTA